MRQRGKYADAFSVSDKALTHLETFVELVERFNPTLNLISASDVSMIWDRHILDCLQLMDLVSQTPTEWLDIGSGGGFPGLVVAIISREPMPFTRFTLVESDTRKCVFLREACRVLDLDAQVVNRRLEDISFMNASIISARAVAPLEKLMTLSFPHLADGGRCLFLKGARYRQEHEVAQASWKYDMIVHPSSTSDGGVILDISNLRSRAVGFGT